MKTQSKGPCLDIFPWNNWKLQDGSRNGSICWEPSLRVSDQQPCAKGPCPLLHKVSQLQKHSLLCLKPPLHRKQPFEEYPKLEAELAKPLHNLVMSMNTHPVRWVWNHNYFKKQRCKHFFLLFLQNSLALPSQSLSAGEDHKCEESPWVDVGPRVQEPDRCEWGGTILFLFFAPSWWKVVFS